MRFIWILKKTIIYIGFHCKWCILIQKFWSNLNLVIDSVTNPKDMTLLTKCHKHTLGNLILVYIINIMHSINDIGLQFCYNNNKNLT